MNKIVCVSLILCLFTFFNHSSVYAEGFIKKEVYSFKDKNGNTVFTDKQPVKEKSFKTQTIETAKSTSNAQYENDQTHYSENISNKEQVIRVIVENGKQSTKKSYKKKGSLKRCSSYKDKFEYYSDKMKSGYKNSEYKKLEKNRKKYRNLLFKNCETATFSD